MAREREREMGERGGRGKREGKGGRGIERIRERRKGRKRGKGRESERGRERACLSYTRLWQTSSCAVMISQTEIRVSVRDLCFTFQALVYAYICLCS